MARLNLLVDDGVPEALAELAGGERKMGIFLSKLVTSMAAGLPGPQNGGDLELLRLSVAAMAGKQREHDGRLLQLESQLATVIAQQSQK